MESDIDKTPKRLNSGHHGAALTESDIMRPPVKRIRTCLLPVPSQMPVLDGITPLLLSDSSTPTSIQSEAQLLVNNNNFDRDTEEGQDETIAEMSIDIMPVMQSGSRSMHTDANNECQSESLPGATVTLSVPPLTHFQQIVQDNYPDLKSDILTDSCGNNALEITHKTVHSHPPAGYIHRTRIVMFTSSSNINGYQFEFQVLFASVKVGVIASDQEFTKLCDQLLRSEGFVFCPGIDYQEYHDNYYSVIRFHISQVNLAEHPFQRVDSKACLRWYKLPKNATLAEQSSDEVLCSACKRLRRYLEHQKKRSSTVSPERRTKRQAANSNYPTKYLSPASINERKKNTQAERSKDKASLSKYAKLDVTLDDSQHDEMCKIAAELDTNHKDQLDTVYKEGGGSESALRSIWGVDKQRAEFYKDQAKNGNSFFVHKLLSFVVYRTW